MRPEDAAALAALETQSRELAIVLDRLERARSSLLPGPATFWRGAARNAYDATIDALGAALDSGIAAVRSARNRTEQAIAGLAARV